MDWTITISRQKGCLGQEVAQELGNLLGYSVVSRDLINQAARRAGAPEAALAAIDELGLLGICPSPQACQAYRQAVESVMHELANRGRVIIVGRAGQVILANQAKTLHVRLVAPAALRAERIAVRFQVSLEGAARQVEASDRFRKNYLKRFYQADWAAAELYDLVINTGRCSVNEAAGFIHNAIQRREVAVNLLSEPLSEQL